MMIRLHPARNSPRVDHALGVRIDRAEDAREDLERQLPRVQLQPETARAEVGKSEFAEGLGEDA